MNFDPYHQWLGISPSEQPPNHYRLLGIAPFEADPAVISQAADQRAAQITLVQPGHFPRDRRAGVLRTTRACGCGSAIAALARCRLIPLVSFTASIFACQQLRPILILKTMPPCSRPFSTGIAPRGICSSTAPRRLGSTRSDRPCLALCAGDPPPNAGTAESVRSRSAGRSSRAGRRSTGRS